MPAFPLLEVYDADLRAREGELRGTLTGIQATRRRNPERHGALLHHSPCAVLVVKA